MVGGGGGGRPYHARIYAQDHVFFALLAFGGDGVGEDGDTAAFTYDD